MLAAPNPAGAVAGVCPQPVVFWLLQVAPLMTETVPGEPGRV
jgi:hypothetical protein